MQIAVGGPVEGATQFDKLQHALGCFRTQHCDRGWVGMSGCNARGVFRVKFRGILIT
jgi:hypothetical protein